MPHDPQVEALVIDACNAVVRGASGEFISRVEDLEDRGWDESAYLITYATLVAVEYLPAADADAAAAFSERVVNRYKETLNVVVPVMEAVIRSAGGESDVMRGVPRDRALVHSLLAIGQIAYEGYVTLEAVFATVREDAGG